MYSSHKPTEYFIYPELQPDDSYIYILKATDGNGVADIAAYATLTQAHKAMFSMEAKEKEMA